MHPLVKALLSHWEWRPEVIFVLLFLGTLYVVGWLRLHQRRQPAKLANKRRLVAYLSGLAILTVSLISPVDLLGSQLFFMHMVQHMLMMMVAAPLLWLGEPFTIGLLGLPAKPRRWVGHLFAHDAGFRRLLRATSGPGVVWLLFVCIFAGWHDPNAYNLAQGRAWVHDLEHISFFVASLLFWWHIVGAAPHVHGRVSVWVRLAMLIGMIPGVKLVPVTVVRANPGS